MEYAERHHVEVVPLSVFSGEEQLPGHGSKKDPTWIKDFYQRLRNKERITTSCPNVDDFERRFTAIAKAGKDFLYIALSSALSATYNVANEVANKLAPQFPERRMFVVDSLSASLGQGLLVDYSIRLQNDGFTVEEVHNWIEEHKLNLCHWFTVDDLFFLKRGGRVNTATAIAGTMLGIKPVLHVDDAGRLINVSKSRGRQNSLKALVDKMAETALNPGKQRVFISHGDCLADAQYVEKLVRERFGVKEFEIDHINPVIGAHAGPGTVALFFFGSPR
jgi:DegV family protein with EDD domain